MSFSRRFCAKSPFKRDTFKIGRKFTPENPRFRSTYSIGGESGSQSGITLPRNPITRASGSLGYGTSKRNINVSGGVHLPTGTGSINISGKTNIGKRTGTSGSITTSRGQKPTYNIGISRTFGSKKNKKKK